MKIEKEKCDSRCNGNCEHKSLGITDSGWRWIWFLVFLASIWLMYKWALIGVYGSDAMKIAQAIRQTLPFL